MTKKWYENDSLRKECSATVLSTKEVGDHFEIVLDGTVIFPEGAGSFPTRAGLMIFPSITRLNQEMTCAILPTRPCRWGKSDRSPRLGCQA